MKCYGIGGLLSFRACFLGYRFRLAPGKICSLSPCLTRLGGSFRSLESEHGLMLCLLEHRVLFACDALRLTELCDLGFCLLLKLLSLGEHGLNTTVCLVCDRLSSIC